MEEPTRYERLFHFDCFLVNTQSGELYRDGARLKIPDQSFDILAMLLERPGEVIKRTEIQKRLWPDDTVVEFENSINAAIKRLRTALGDSAEQPRFIETIPRRGYRFVGTLTEVPAKGVERGNAGKTRWVGIRRWAALVVAGTAVATLCVLFVARFSRLSDASRIPEIEVVPLARMPGNEFEPSFSPDGNQAAFALNAGKNSGIYTMMVGGEKVVALTKGPGDCCPAWSPDGREIAFSRATEWSYEVYVVPAVGGSERRVVAWPKQTEHNRATLPWRENSRVVNWSPDGKMLALTEISGDRTHARVTLFSMDEGTFRPLSSPPEGTLDYGPSFSPDGRSIAFVRASAAGVVEDLYIVPASGGEPRRLTFDNTIIMGAPAWTRDGKELVFSSSRAGLPTLWRVEVLGGTPRPVLGAGASVSFPAISRIGNQLAYQQMSDKMNILETKVRNGKQQSPATLAIFQKGGNSRPQFSPDGRRIVFESNRSGFSEIWTCDADGANPTQMTSLHGTAGAARWSPDGRYIAFEFRPKEHSEVYLLEVASRATRMLTTLPGANNGGPNWSRDGKRIYFYSDKGGGPFEVWSLPSEGGTAVQATRQGGVFAQESADSRSLYFMKLEAPGIWRMPLAGGEESRILSSPPGESWWNWAVAQDGIYFFGTNNDRYADVRSGINFTGTNAELKWGIYFYEFATKKTNLVAATGKPSVGLAASADGTSLLFEQNEWSDSSIMLVKNFR